MSSMTIVRGSVRAGQFSGLGALSMGQRDAIINKWTDAKKLLPAVLTLPYDTKSLKDAAFAVDQALMDFRKGTMTDDVFGAKLSAVIVSIGDITTAEGDLVIDLGTSASDTINKFLDALPNMKGKVTVTGPEVGFTGQKSGIPGWAWGLGLVAVVGLVLATREK
jgi:hypothetical protein